MNRRSRLACSWGKAAFVAYSLFDGLLPTRTVGCYEDAVVGRVLCPVCEDKCFESDREMLQYVGAKDQG